MSSNRMIKSAALVLAVTAASSAFAQAQALSTFSYGDIAVLRGGDTLSTADYDNSVSTAQIPVYIDEYQPTINYVTQSISYAPVGTVAVPSTGTSALTLPSIGDFQHDGVLNISADGKSLSFAGYQVPVGSADAFAAGGADQPVVGVVGTATSTLNTTTIVNSYGSGSSSPYIRGAYTNNGTQFWTFGKYASTGATSNGGLAYVSGTGPTATTTTVEGFADWRDVVAANGQLYGGTGSSSVGNHGPYQISTGEPTTNLGNSLANNTQLGAYPGGQSASALALLDLPGDANTSNGLNVLYTIGDQGTAGITKYYFNGSTWVNQTNVGLTATGNVVNPTGLIANVDPTNPNWVDITVTGTNGIYTYVDETGYNGAIPANAFTESVAAPTNEAFYGTSNAVPEPASLSLLALGAASLLGRRNRRNV